MNTLLRPLLCLSWLGLATALASAALQPVALRTEWLPEPQGVDATAPRLSWRVEANERGQRQTAYHILVASEPDRLRPGRADLWDSGVVASAETLNIPYAGQPLRSGQRCFWSVQVRDAQGRGSRWSPPASWSMGLLKPADWQAQWIAFRDSSPLHTNRAQLSLPPARHYRKAFEAPRKVQRATLYCSALGLATMHLNGQRVGDAYFESGWADYIQRAYYRTHDVTKLIRRGGNRLGAIVADGWYAGYVGYGLLVGYGPDKTGRNFYGKTPALLAQLELEYTDGSRETIVTDTSWEVSSDGPIREADLIMGEAFDAAREDANWCLPTALARKERGPSPAWKWEPAIRAEDNGSTKARFYDNRGVREVELGFQRPPVLQAYSAPPIRVTGELKAQRLTEPKPGTYIFDLGQNFAGNVRLKLKGPAGTRLQIRYGEMLHPDGRLMTENLRKARATDFYTFRGDPRGETWTPQFTYHGFQFVELTGLPSRPALDAVTGLVLHNDTPLTGEFACSDPVLTRFWKNTQWTQRANFIEVPTDCPQRDERLGWMGDAQIYARTASFNADVAAFFTKWTDDVREAQLGSGAYPDYAPYPMGHGGPSANHGTAWTDAGVICPWTMWQVYGDTRILERHWDSMTRFMDWRKRSSPDLRGVKLGNTWGDWLNVNEPTPIEFVDAAYFAQSARMMSEMAVALGRADEAARYREWFSGIRAAFQADYVKPDGSLKVETQTAYVLALAMDLLPPTLAPQAADRLAARIAQNEFRMATGFLGTKALLPALTAHGHHDLAVRLFQSRKFPSWGYEVEQGANSVWERWDSYTREHGFNGAGGNQNAAMNSFSHYSFGAVMEWAFRSLAGVDTDGPGYPRLILRPGPPAPGSNPDRPALDWVKADYLSPRGLIRSAWQRNGNRFELELILPANTTATLHLPAAESPTITEAGRPLAKVPGVKLLRQEGDRAVLALESGRYRFSSRWPSAPAR